MAENNTTPNPYIEFEHKFVIDSSTNVQKFYNAVTMLAPIESKRLDVQELYIQLSGHKSYIFRYRSDKEQQLLTVKSTSGNIEKRLEVNLELSQTPQLSEVLAFFKTLGSIEVYELSKKLVVFYFEDCEIVHYIATYRDKSCSCIEFEAKRATDDEHARAILESYEKRLGFDSSQRSESSLFQMLIESQGTPS